MMPVDPRLALKTTPPRLSRQLLERPRLNLAALQLQGTAIVRVEAPAGFGKTSLLGQWRKELMDAGSFVAWLTIDQNDDSPGRFIEALSYAMEQATGSAAFLRIRKREVTAHSDRDRLTEWLAEVANLSADCALILDEVELLPPDTAQNALLYLLSNLPPNLKVMAASRTRPKFRLTDPTARGAPAIFSANALRFSLPETIATLQNRFGSRIDADAAQRIHQVTEGWPLGLQLVVSAMANGMTAREALELLMVKSGDLRQRFVSSLLSHLPEDMTDFLVRVSIMERINADLCAALTGRLDVAAVLDRLRDTAPLLASDLGGDWLSLHALIRDFLRERFDALPLGQRRAAHAAAATWLETNGMLDEAARHAQEAGHTRWAWDMAERSLLAMLEAGQVGEVQSWLARSPLPTKEQHPRLLLTAGWCCALNGQTDAGVTFANRVLADTEATDHERLRARVVLSSCAIFSDDPERAAEIIAGWRDALMATPAVDRFNGFNQLVWLALNQGNVAEARRILRQQQLADDSPFVMQAYRALLWAQIYSWEGSIPLAIEALTHIHAQADQETGRRSCISATLSGTLALVLVERGDIDEAEAVLAGRLDVIEQQAGPTSMIYGFIAASRVACARGDHPRAHELLETLIAVGERRRMPRVQCSGLVELIRQHAALGNVPACRALLIRFESRLDSMPRRAGGMMELYLKLASAWTAHAAQHWSRVLEALDAALEIATRLNRGRELLEIAALRTAALEASGQDAQAARQQATALASGLGLRVPSLRESISAGHANRPYEAPSPVTRAPRVAPTPLLTPKEQYILNLLAQQFSNKQIATRLDISITTTKWHLRNAYSKLNAVSRRHAVQRARLLGILDAA